MPDPKLQQAINEIDAVLTKHNIAGIVFVASESHAHYLHHLQASWNACYMENTPKGEALRVRCKRADYPTRDAWRLAMKNSVGTIMGFIDVCKNTAEALTGLAVRIAATGNTIEHMTKEDPPHGRF